METQIIDFHTHIYPVALARRAMEVDVYKRQALRGWRCGTSCAG